MSSDDEPTWILDRDEDLVALRAWAYPDGRGHLYAGNLEVEVEVELNQEDVEGLAVALVQGAPLTGISEVLPLCDGSYLRVHQTHGLNRVVMSRYWDGVATGSSSMTRETAVEFALALLRAAKEAP